MKSIGRKGLRLKEDDKDTVIYLGKEIQRGSLPGDAYAKKVEDEIKDSLMVCINCSNFEFTPLSVNMGYAYKGRCIYLAKKNKEGRASSSIVPIFYVCPHFKFAPLKDRIEKMKEKMNKLHGALKKSVEKKGLKK